MPIVHARAVAVGVKVEVHAQAFAGVAGVEIGVELLAEVFLGAFRDGRQEVRRGGGGGGLRSRWVGEVEVRDDAIVSLAHLTDGLGLAADLGVDWC